MVSNQVIGFWMYYCCLPSIAANIIPAEMISLRSIWFCESNIVMVYFSTNGLKCCLISATSCPFSLVIM